MGRLGAPSASPHRRALAATAAAALVAAAAALAAAAAAAAAAARAAVAHVEATIQDGGVDGTRCQRTQLLDVALGALATPGGAVACPGARRRAHGSSTGRSRRSSSARAATTGATCNAAAAAHAELTPLPSRCRPRRHGPMAAQIALYLLKSTMACAAAPPSPPDYFDLSTPVELRGAPTASTT